MTKPEAETTRPKVTVVMIPRERFSCARESIDGLYENTHMLFDLIYVDTNAPRRHASELQAMAESRGFRILRTDRYLKPAQARNVGARAADGEYVVFVDNDVAYAPGWLENLVACADETGADVVGPLACQFEPLHEEIHAAGGRIMEPAEFERFRKICETGEQDLTAVEPKFEICEVIHKQGQKVADEAANLKRCETGFVEFHCCLVRRDTLERVGYLDDRLSTKEHLDFCLSVIRNGGTIYLEPTSIITYFAFSDEHPLSLSDLNFYLVRWSTKWHKSSLSLFMRKWSFADNGYTAQKMWVAGWRRRLALQSLAKRVLPSILGEMPSKVVARLVAPFESIYNGIASARHGSDLSLTDVVEVTDAPQR